MAAIVVAELDLERIAANFTAGEKGETVRTVTGVVEA